MLQTIRTSVCRLLHFISIIVVLQTASWAAVQSAVLVGHWEGTIQVPGTPLSIMVDIAETDGKLSGTVSIPQQGAKDLPLVNVSVNGQEVAFAMAGVPGEPKFRGTLADGGVRITGKFSQGTASLPFTLERRADPVAAAKESLAGFDAIATDAMTKFDVPGMAIAIIKGKQVVLAQGYGWRDVAQKLPVTPDTLFAIGSSSKAFTTFVLGTLVDEGKLEWDKPVRNYIPWFKLYDPVLTERLSVRDLVTHRSGLPRHDLVWYNNYKASRESLVRRLPYLEPSADLRERWQYNNLMFLTAGYLIEVLTGGTWEAAVRARILTPLGMRRTNFSVADSQQDSDFARPYEKKDDKVVLMPFRPITNIGPAGSINSSVNEMAQWVIAHLNGGRVGEQKIAEAATVAEMHKAQMTTGAASDRPDITGGEYGLGWFIDNYRGHLRVRHGGNIDGFSANVVLFPKDDLGMVVLTNLNGTPLRDLIAQVAADKVLKLEPVDWITQGAARRALSEKAGKEGEKKKAVTRVAGTQPSHKLADYVGEYEHSGYGLLTVQLRDGRLSATFNDIETPLEHWHYDTFNGAEGKDDTFANMKYNFTTDTDGFIASVTAIFEPAVSAISFARQPDARFSDPAYLARFVGEYDLLGQTLKVSQKGNALTLGMGGQPPMDLVPTLSSDFKLKQQQLITLHFVTDEQGNISAIELRQPATVLTAKRKK